jgi:hypothetical protein
MAIVPKERDLQGMVEVLTGDGIYIFNFGPAGADIMFGDKTMRTSTLSARKFMAGLMPKKIRYDIVQGCRHTTYDYRDRGNFKEEQYKSSYESPSSSYRYATSSYKYSSGSRA